MEISLMVIAKGPIDDTISTGLANGSVSSRRRAIIQTNDDGYQQYIIWPHRPMC